MALKSQEAKASSGGDSNSELYEMLRTPGVTSEEIESFSNTDAGYAAWTNLGRVPEFMLIEPAYSMIKGSPSAYMALVRDEEIFAIFGNWNPDSFVSSDEAMDLANLEYSKFEEWVLAENDSSLLTTLVLSVDAINIIALDAQKRDCFFGSKWVQDMVISSKAMMHALSYNEVVGRAVGHVPEFVANLFNSPSFDSLTKITQFVNALVSTANGMHCLFDDYAIRKLVWDKGGKAFADVILRTNAFARQWLWDNVRASRSAHTSNGSSLAKRGYMLQQYNNTNDSSEYSYAGTFVGDHQSGNKHAGASWRGAINHNERVNPIYVKNQASSSGDITYIYYVQMEA